MRFGKGFDLNSTIVTVGAVTYAIKARKLFLRRGIQSKLVKVDSGKTQNGCTHGVEIDNVDFYAAIKILKDNGIAYSVYSSKS